MMTKFLLGNLFKRNFAGSIRNRIAAISLLIGLLMVIVSGCIPNGFETVEQITTSGDKLPVQVLSISDGDTMIVKAQSEYKGNDIHLQQGRELKVRLLLLDTPESVGKKAGMPFGKEASDFAKRTLNNQMVELEFDKGEKQDHYGRYLVYLYVNGERFQEIALREGMGIVRYVQEPNTKYLQEFLAAEEEARAQKKGVWSIKDYATSQEGYNEGISKSSSIPSLIEENISKEKITELITDAAIEWIKN